MSNPPLVDSRQITDLLALAQQQALNVSGGILSDTSPGSPLTAILEAVVTIGYNVIQDVNLLAASLEATRINSLGVNRVAGSQSLASVQVTLDAQYATSFVLPGGFPITFNGVPFTTISDLTIPAYSLSGTTIIQSANIGLNTNVPQNSPAVFQSLPRLSTITLIQAAYGGQDADSDDVWKAKIYGSLRRRDTLISEGDFTAEIVSFLGSGSVGLTIGKLKPDQATYANGYVSCFGLNADGTLLTTAQQSQLQAYLNQKAAMASVSLTSFSLFNVGIEVICGFISGTSPDALSQQIYNLIVAYLKPGSLPPGKAILNKALELRIQGITGVQEGIISVLVNGFAQPQPLPSLWSFAKLTTVKITLTPADSSANYNTYNF